jgi:tetratricopeptide (TPR) repeat protein
LSRTKKLTGSNQPTLDDARALEAQSEALTEKGQHDRAIELAGQALAIRHALVGDGVLTLVDGLRTLGYALYMADRNEEALPYIAESVRILEGLDGTADPRLVIDTYVTATLLQATGRQDTAWPYFASWVAQSLGRGAAQDQKFAPVALGLLRHYIASSQLPDALELLDGAMPILTASLEEESPAYCRLLADHAFVLEACGRYREASEVAEASCALNLRVLGRHASAYLSSLGRLASIRRALHDPTGARALAEQVVALCAEAPGIGGDHLPTALWDLAENALATGNLDQAEAHFRHAIELFRALPEASNNLAAALNGLGNLYAQTGHLAKVAESLHEALTLYTQLYGERSLLCGQVMSEMAAVYINGDDLAEADRYMAESIAIVREAAGEAHPAYARSLHDRGVIQRKLGHTAQAREMFEKSTLALEAALGPDHLLVANHLQSLGDMNRADGNFAESEAQLTRALAMMQPVLHPSHTNLRTTTRSLAAVHAATGRFDAAMALTSQELEGELEMTCQLFALSSEDQRMQLLAAGSALDVLLTLVHRHFIDEEPAVRGAFEHVLRRKGMGAEALSAQREASHAARSPDPVPRVQRSTRTSSPSGANNAPRRRPNSAARSPNSRWPPGSDAPT